MLPIKMKVVINTHVIPAEYTYTLRDRGKVNLDGNCKMICEYIDTFIDREHEIALKCFEKKELTEEIGDLLLRIEREGLHVACNGIVECLVYTNKGEFYTEKQKWYDLGVGETRKIRIMIQSKPVIAVEIM